MFCYKQILFSENTRKKSELLHLHITTDSHEVVSSFYPIPHQKEMARKLMGNTIVCVKHSENESSNDLTIPRALGAACLYPLGTPEVFSYPKQQELRAV